MTDEPVARVEQGPNGELILVDPVACAVAKAVSKHNCWNTYELQMDRVAHFRSRAKTLEKSPKEVVIVLANVDDPNGQILAEALMPSFNWDEIRARGEVPFARGLADRNAVLDFVRLVDPEMAIEDDPQQVQLVVVDHGVCEIF